MKNVEKLKSGSFRIRAYSEGKTYSRTLDHKPTRNEVKHILGELLSEHLEEKKRSGTYAGAYRDYVKMRTNTCSPTTLRGYDVLFRNTPKWFTEMNIYDITQKHVQQMINEYSGSHSPKSVYNLRSLANAVLKTERPSMKLSVKIPDMRPAEVYVPTKEEVDAILEEVKGTKYEVALGLAATCGLRRSEICALTLDDLVVNPEGYFIKVTKAKVQDQRDEWQVKPYTKTPESAREVLIPDHLGELIQKQGYVYIGHPEHINNRLKAAEEKLGIQHFSLHKLRHFWTSEMHAMGASEAVINASGGWSKSHTVKKNYRHPRNVVETQKQFVSKFYAS